MIQVTACNECGRLVSTHFVHASIGAIETADQHTNQDGQRCFGSSTEAAVIWGERADFEAAVRAGRTFFA